MIFWRRSLIPIILSSGDISPDPFFTWVPIGTRSLESGDISPDPKSRWADCNFHYQLKCAECKCILHLNNIPLQNSAYLSCFFSSLHVTHVLGLTSKRFIRGCSLNELFCMKAPITNRRCCLEIKVKSYYNFFWQIDVLLNNLGCPHPTCRWGHPKYFSKH